MQEKPALGLREAKKLATRKELTRAARELVLQHGFDAMTVEMIAAQAQVSVRTFFNYFDTKESAILGAAEPLGTESGRQTFLANGPTGDLLSDMIELTVDSSEQQLPERVELVMVHSILQAEPRLMASQMARFVESEERACELIAERLQRNGIPDTGSDEIRTIAAVAFTVLRRAGYEWFHNENSGGTPEDLRYYLERARDQVARLFSSTPSDTAPHTD